VPRLVKRFEQADKAQGFVDKLLGRLAVIKEA